MVTFQTPDEYIAFGFLVPGIDISDISQEEGIEVTSRISPVTTKRQLVAMTQAFHGCPSDLTIILAFLFCTGIVASVVGCAYAGLHSKKCRQNIIFVHLFLSNFGSILFIPFAVAARVLGYWDFQNVTFVALSFVTSLSQVVVAFQLTLLATLRCKQILSNEEFVTTTCTKVVSFFIWIIALPIAAFSILDSEILAGTIKSETFSQTSETQQLYIIGFVFGSLIPVGITLFCIVYSCRKHTHQTAHGDNGKVDNNLRRDLREVMLLSVLYIVSCMPVQIYRWWPRRPVNGCDIPLNILICTVALFSLLSPILHIAYVSSSGRNVDEEIIISKDSEVTLDVMNEFGKRNEEKDGEKTV